MSRSVKKTCAFQDLPKKIRIIESRKAKLRAKSRFKQGKEVIDDKMFDCSESLYVKNNPFFEKLVKK